MNTKVVSPIRCAIYTRVSDDQGLERDFNSLDAQYDAAEAYIKSQKHVGWVQHPERYDDGGFSGGNTDRPSLQRLLDDVCDRKINVVVVYKVDRLTRSLSDFAKVVDLFDKHDVSFASVTQPFNTTTSMGRLTLNVLLSFAQFEREIAGERIRDKIAASKRKGVWVGGPIALGYQTSDLKVSVNKPEARRVRMIFRKYLKLGTLYLLRTYLGSHGVVATPRYYRNGKLRRGCPYTTSGLGHMLRNRCYIGELIIEGEIFKAPYPAIIDADLFNAVQRRLDKQRVGRCRGHPPTQLA